MASSDAFLQLIVQREQARQGKDFETADAIRNQLKGMGVEIFDKTRTWKSADGQSGRVPTFDEIEQAMQTENMLQGPMGAARSPRMQQATPVPSRGLGASFFSAAPAFGAAPAGGAGEEISSEQISQLIADRERARGMKDYAASDNIRDQLKSMGVEIYDKEKLWKQSSTGLMGVCVGYGTRQIMDTEINILVAQRERARGENDFVTADMIRQELSKFGVEVYDREKIWKSEDGREGELPNFASVQQVPGLGATPSVSRLPARSPILAQTMPSSMPSSMPSRTPATSFRAPVSLPRSFVAPGPVGPSSTAFRGVKREAPIENSWSEAPPFEPSPFDTASFEASQFEASSFEASSFEAPAPVPSQAKRRPTGSGPPLDDDTVMRIKEYLHACGGKCMLGNLAAEFRGLKKAQLVGHFRLDVVGNHQTQVTMC